MTNFSQNFPQIQSWNTIFSKFPGGMPPGPPRKLMLCISLSVLRTLHGVTYCIYPEYTFFLFYNSSTGHKHTNSRDSSYCSVATLSPSLSPTMIILEALSTRRRMTALQLFSHWFGLCFQVSL